MTAIPRYSGEQLRPIGPLADDVKDYFRAAGVPEEMLEPAPLSSELPHDHPVSRLLASPSAVLADRDQWPTAGDLAEGVDLLADVRTSWLEGRARRSGGPWCDPHSRKADLVHAACDRPMPFPVGQECPEWAIDAFSTLRVLMPFAGNVHAVTILPETMGGHEVITFVLAERIQTCTMEHGKWRRMPDAWCFTGEVRRTVDGDPEVEVPRCSWARSLAGLPVGRGRPPGSRYESRSFPAMLDALKRYRWERDATTPPRFIDLLMFAEGYAASVESAKSLRDDLTNEWDMDWDEFVRLVYGDARRTFRIRNP